MEKLKITIVPSFIKGALYTSIFILLGAIIITACEDIRIGKTKEDLAREMFEVDSLIMRIQLELDSTAMDFNRIYIDSQRINNGH